MSSDLKIPTFPKGTPPTPPAPPARKGLIITAIALAVIAALAALAAALAFGGILFPVSAVVALGVTALSTGLASVIAGIAARCMRGGGKQESLEDLEKEVQKKITEEEFDDEATYQKACRGVTIAKKTGKKAQFCVQYVDFYERPLKRGEAFELKFEIADALKRGEDTSEMQEKAKRLAAFVDEGIMTLKDLQYYELQSLVYLQDLQNQGIINSDINLDPDQA